MKKVKGPDGNVYDVGYIYELFPLNEQLFNKLCDMGMERWQAILYILSVSVIFDVDG